MDPSFRVEARETSFRSRLVEFASRRLVVYEGKVVLERVGWRGVVHTPVRGLRGNELRIAALEIDFEGNE